MGEMALDQVKRLALQLSRAERETLAAWLEETRSGGTSTPVPSPSRSLYGAWADLGSGPGESEIERARGEIWRAFPREDTA